MTRPAVSGTPPEDSFRLHTEGSFSQGIFARTAADLLAPDAVAMPHKPFLTQFFSPQTLSRGQTYHADGAVSQLERVDETTWRAYVRGTQRRPYVTTLRIAGTLQEPTDFDSVCSCPVEEFCKHAAAVFFALSEQNAQPALPDAPVQSPALTPTAWLDAVERAVAPVAPQASPGGSMRAYRITAPRGPTLLAGLHVAFGRRAAKGRFLPNADTYTEPSEVETWLRLIFPEHVRWGALMGVGSVEYIESPHLAQLVMAMAHTHNLFWGERDDQLLSWGPERVAQLLWRPRPGAQLELTLEVAPGVCVLAGEPTLYIDPRERCVGILRHLVPRSVLRQLADAPSLPVDEAAAFAERLGASVRAFLPAPPRLSHRFAEPAPMPRLHVDAVCTDDGLHMAARLAFQYGDQEVSYSDAQTSVIERHGDSLVEMRRAVADEAAAKQQLEALVGEAAGEHWHLGAVDDIQQYGSWVERLTQLRQLGWEVQEAQKPLRRIVEAQAPVAVQVEDGDDGNEGHDWFNLKMGVELEGVSYDLAPLLSEALQRPELGLDADWSHLGDRVYLPLDSERLVAFPKSRLKSLLTIVRELMAGSGLGLGTAVQLTHLLDTGDCQLRGQAFLLSLAQRLRACDAGVVQAPPRGLQANLRPYQQHGLNWLAFLREHALGGVLADDMGLGKTLQTLSHLLALHEAGPHKPFLVVVPTSVLANWQAEAARFAPGLSVTLHYGLARQRHGVPDCDMVLTSYGTLLRDIDAFVEIEFDTVVLDESHVIKNPRSRLHHAVRRLRAAHRLCLSGTPLQNNLEELWAQFAFLMPGLLDSHDKFTKTFRKPIERLADNGRRSQLQMRVRPFMLRRTKAEVVRDLPPKSEVVERIVLRGAQRDLYEAVRNLMDKRVREALALQGVARSSIVVLDALLKLRQVCCDPRLVRSPTAARVKTSAKLERLEALLEELVAEGRRVLVFSQFTSMLELIGQSLRDKDIGYAMLTGKTRDRGALVQRFQEGEFPVFLLSLKAGGVGLNLTAADTVIHYDPWWNPAIEAQATDRAHRIGQDKPVFVYKLLVAGSVEERILALQERKAQLVAGVLEDGAMREQLTAEDLQGLFAPLGV